LPIARKAHPPPGARSELRRVDTEQPEALGTATKGIAVYDIGAWAIDDHRHILRLVSTSLAVRSLLQRLSTWETAD
jgi:hypothetical protein